jgi:hypothetical protein
VMGSPNRSATIRSEELRMSQRPSPTDPAPEHYRAPCHAHIDILLLLATAPRAASAETPGVKQVLTLSACCLHDRTEVRLQ